MSALTDHILTATARQLLTILEQREAGKVQPLTPDSPLVKDFIDAFNRERGKRQQVEDYEIIKVRQ